MVILTRPFTKLNVNWLRPEYHNTLFYHRMTAACASNNYDHVCLYIRKVHPNGLSWYLIQMLHMEVVHFCIASMHPDKTSECNYVRLFYIFRACICIEVHLLLKYTCYYVFPGKVHFYGFGGKPCFCGFDGRVRLWWEFEMIFPKCSWVFHLDVAF